MGYAFSEQIYKRSPRREYEFPLLDFIRINVSPVMVNQARILLLLLLLLLNASPSAAQHSVAREWNEVLLQSIREDFARPTVHARNLFHVSAAMWDAWSVFELNSEPYFLGNSVSGFECEYDGFPMPSDIEASREMAISFAAYRVLKHRFKDSPGSVNALARFDSLMSQLGYDYSNISSLYGSGDPATLGNHIAQCVIDFGLNDGANERELYTNRFYRPVNPPLTPALPGNPHILDLNRWQPLSFDIFIDQSGNEIPGGVPEFVGPEWGSVIPFSLNRSELSIKERNGREYWIYHDPGSPPLLDRIDGLGMSDEYKWNFSLVAIWSSHLDPNDGVMWDISPAALGNLNIDAFPRDISSLRTFYNAFDGGDFGKGHRLNPATGQPYWAQVVPRGDYARVLAEFWADGPDSETPPGHWFTILNYVSDHPLLEKRFRGQGPLLNDLEWDVKAYFALGGAMHDSAIASWAVKGWYDYIRPISAIRGMAEFGQSTDESKPRYHPAGITLIPGFIEMVSAGDPLAGAQNEHLDEVKIRSWRGPSFVFDPEEDEGGVDWVLAANWWPYQRPSFVTPPFAGYVSGHSTFSRAAAEVLTALTGDAFFPGGIGEFVAKQDEFLVFEDGPSVDVVLQWATYRDASDQTSLSRIWGGIHPPADDIPGRIMGERIGIDAFNFAERFLQGTATGREGPLPLSGPEPIHIFPNPVSSNSRFSLPPSFRGTLTIIDSLGRVVFKSDSFTSSSVIPFESLAKGVYFASMRSRHSIYQVKFVVGM